MPSSKHRAFSKGNLTSRTSLATARATGTRGTIRHYEKSVQLGGALSLSILLAACGENQNVEAGNSQAVKAGPAAPRAEIASSAAGEVTAIEGDQVTIAHGPVDGLGWPAMTMTFQAGSPGIANGLNVGDRVSFEFKEFSGSYTLTSMSKAD